MQHNNAPSILPAIYVLYKPEVQIIFSLYINEIPFTPCSPYIFSLPSQYHYLEREVTLIVSENVRPL